MTCLMSGASDQFLEGRAERARCLAARGVVTRAGPALLVVARVGAAVAGAGVLAALSGGTR